MKVLTVLKNLLAKNAALLLGLALLLASSLGARADYVTDATDMVANGTTVFTAVSTLVVTMVGFFILIKIVKGIRK